MAIEVRTLPFTRLPCLCGLNETQDCGYRFPLPPDSDRSRHNAMSAALLNATRTPMLTWLTRILPPFCALCSASQSLDFRILAGPPSELQDSNDLFLFVPLYHGACFLAVSRRRVVCFDGPFGNPRCEPRRFALFHAATGCRLFPLSARKLSSRPRPAPAASRPWPSFQAASPSLECRRSPKRGGRLLRCLLESAACSRGLVSGASPQSCHRVAYVLLLPAPPATRSSYNATRI